MSSSQDQKAAVMRQVKEEASLASGKQLIEKFNEHCFEKCIPKPGTTLSASETTCLTQCMEKYMMMWSVIHRQYTSRIALELEKSNRGGS
ncbi:Mitochondrial import inner membrane translocase subunit tim13 [Golovinomyces cichoracearum]|uniref:Mitochondrial import inner membrane translocase subunit n=1 Tax=Golovinomyces cichoracearum TaxID=62708 RepID=A0A420J365_9PEZI|nr:Mitochondrial import inner membrane translocase subunit tim13 [Golovinomyces cichoracearum]